MQLIQNKVPRKSILEPLGLTSSPDSLGVNVIFRTWNEIFRCHQEFTPDCLAADQVTKNQLFFQYKKEMIS